MNRKHNQRSLGSFLRRLSLGLVLTMILCTQSAWAEECNDVPELGQCVDLKTLQWCDEGVLKTVKCPEDEICVKTETDDGHFTCMKKGYTPCADIPDEGKCTSGNSAVWCVDGRVEVKKCKEDEVCTLIPEGWVDCVPAEHLQPPPPESDTETPNGDDAGHSAQDAEGAEIGPDNFESEDGTNPTPNVRQGDSYEPVPVTGCSVGQSSTPWTMGILMLLALFSLLRRRS